MYPRLQMHDRFWIRIVFVNPVRLQTHFSKWPLKPLSLRYKISSHFFFLKIKSNATRIILQKLYKKDYQIIFIMHTVNANVIYSLY